MPESVRFEPNIPVRPGFWWRLFHPHTHIVPVKDCYECRVKLERAGIAVAVPRRVQYDSAMRRHALPKGTRRVVCRYPGPRLSHELPAMPRTTSQSSRKETAVAENIRFEPNTPVRLSLKDPLATDYDYDLQQGRFETPDGRQVLLPRPAVQILYALEPAPGEEIQITRHLKGKVFSWTICLTPKSEQLRAAEEQAQDEQQEPASLVSLLEASVEQAKASRKPVGVPTLVKRPPRKATVPAANPSDLGRPLPATGTDGPSPQRAAVPAASSPTRTRPAVLPWNVAFREVTAWVANELAANKLQWSDESQKSMVCTVLIAEVKAGRIGPWERAE